MELAVEKLVYGGDGLGRWNGQVVLTPYVLPGETIVAEARERKPGLLRARLVEILAPAAERVEPPCPFFYRCGGCQYQHAAYEAQLQAKRGILAEALRRIGKIEPPEAIGVVSGEPWRYRNRVQLHIEGPHIGYRRARSHRLCAIDHCPISSPAVNRALEAVREMLRDPRWPRFIRSVELFSNESETQLNVLDSARPVARRFFEWCAERIPGAARTALDYSAGGRTFRVSNRSFFQVNRFLVDALVESALQEAEGGRALDLYAGVGLFSLPLAARFRSVTAVEGGAAAVRDLEFNAARAGMAVETVQSETAACLQKLTERPDFVLADPPRAGLGPAVVRELARLQAPRLTLVACDPATLARDLAALTASGYSIDRLILIDLFPQTYHFETVAHLRRSVSSAI
ncbi:MAG: class I SAM-dependent RNA methyltransferase [Bryobacterales bacterium]|nr:class I SAM-dependent RNA methyltransferase [Bryobacterales bacterium]